MPPKTNRQRAGSLKSTTTTAGTTTTTSTNGVPGVATTATTTLTPDVCHNTNQPCCQHLTDLAHKIFPATTSTTTAASIHISPHTTDAAATTTTTTTSPSAPSSTAASYDTSSSFWTLLREHLLHERRIRIKEDLLLLSESSTKKKRKKKKKKKISSGSTTDDLDGMEGEDSYHESTTTSDITPATDDQAQGHDASVHNNTGSSTTTPLERITRDVPPSLDAASPVATTTTTTAPYDDETTREQQSRRLVRRLLDHFLDQQHSLIAKNNIKSTSINDASSFSTNGGTTVDLSRLHEFVATLTESTMRPKTGISTTPLRKNQPATAAASGWGNGDANFTCITLPQIEKAVQTIQCSACRRDVERVLFSSSFSLYPSRLWLKGIQASTRYDSFEDHDEEAQTTHYQLLMEEGLEPPEHAQHWSWTSTTNQYNSRSNGNDTTRAVPAGKDTTILGWELQRPKTRRAPSPLVSVSNETVLQINDSTTTAAHQWSMEDVEFLLEHYAILMGLPPDAVTMASGSSTTVSAAAALNTISLNVSELTNKTTQKFRDMAQSIQNDLVELPPRDYFMAQNIHWDAFRTLEKVNGTCDKVIGELLTIVWDVTLSVQKVLLYAGYREECLAKANAPVAAEGVIEESTCAGETGVASNNTVLTDETHWAVAQCQILWRYYFEDISTILSSVGDYHEALLNHAERSGTFPDFFVSPPLRGAFHDLVQTKLKVATFLLQKIEHRTQHETPIGPWRNANCTSSTTTFLSRLWTEQAFGDSVVDLDAKSVSGREQMDEAWKHVLFFVREMTVIEQHQRTDAKLVAGQRQRRDKVIRLLTTTLDSVSDLLAHPLSDDENGSNGRLDDLMGLQQDISRATESRSVTNFDDESSPLDQLKSMRSWSAKMIPELQRVTYRWAGLRQNTKGLTLSRKDKCPNLALALPHSLRRSMIPGTGSSAFDILFDDDDVREPCNGGDGHVRATCILVSLFFQNTSERFQEWQAQKAAQELLTTMLDDDTAAQAVKANKKSRKKVHKKTVSSSEKSPSVSEPLQPVESAVSFTENEATTSLERRNGGRGSDVSAVHHVENQLVDTMPQADEQSSNEPWDDADTPEPAESDRSSNGIIALTDPEPEPTVSNGARPSDVTAAAASTQLDDVKEMDAVMNNVIYLEKSQRLGVYDDRSGGFQEAEAFLVGRLLSLIDANEDLLLVHQ